MVRLNSIYSVSDFSEKLQLLYEKGKSEKNIIVYEHPFKCCSLANFLEEVENVSENGSGDMPCGLEKLQNEVKSLNFVEKVNDLYSFRQTDDLMLSEGKTVGKSNECASKSFSELNSFKMLLKDSVLSLLRNVTGIKELTDNISLFAANYKDTDVLLCHDDELEHRRVAFIYYLTPSDWCEEDGGLLQLFNARSDEASNESLPGEVTQSLIPHRNSFLFFEVSSSSFHQVSEILSSTKERLSLSGWFHGPPLVRPKPKITPIPTSTLLKPSFVTEDVLVSWINQLYLDFETQNSIRSKFFVDSEIELQSFINPGKYRALVRAIECPELQKYFCSVNEPNSKCYTLLSIDERVSFKEIDEGQKRLQESLKILREFEQVFRSEAMFLVLSQLTGLFLHPLYSASVKAAATTTTASNDDENEQQAGTANVVSESKNQQPTLNVVISDDDEDESESVDDPRGASVSAVPLDKDGDLHVHHRKANEVSMASSAIRSKKNLVGDDDKDHEVIDLSASDGEDEKEGQSSGVAISDEKGKLNELSNSKENNQVNSDKNPATVENGEVITEKASDDNIQDVSEKSIVKNPVESKKSAVEVSSEKKTPRRFDLEYEEDSPAGKRKKVDDNSTLIEETSDKLVSSDSSVSEKIEKNLAVAQVIDERSKTKEELSTIITTTADKKHDVEMESVAISGHDEKISKVDNSNTTDSNADNVEKVIVNDKRSSCLSDDKEESEKTIEKKAKTIAVAKNDVDINNKITSERAASESPDVEVIGEEKTTSKLSETLIPTPRCTKSSIIRWEPKSYTLLLDTDPSAYQLDVIFYFGLRQTWDPSHGGCITYIAKSEKEELLTVVPKNNSVALIFRDDQTLRFTKYINHKARQEKKKKNKKKNIKKLSSDKNENNEDSSDDDDDDVVLIENPDEHGEEVLSFRKTKDGIFYTMTMSFYE